MRAMHSRWVLLLTCRVISPAYATVLASGVCLNRLLMKTLNMVGPKTLPFSTPEGKDLESDSVPPYFTCCIRSDKYDVNQFNRLLLIWHWAWLSNRTWWLRVSKAFEKSIVTMDNHCLLRRVSNSRLESRKRAVSHDRHLRNPCCAVLSRPWVSRWLVSFCPTIFSNTLLMRGSSEMGL